jgi:hypothetical protein
MTTTGKIEDDNIVIGAIVDGTQALQSYRGGHL